VVGESIPVQSDQGTENSERQDWTHVKEKHIRVGRRMDLSRPMNEGEIGAWVLQLETRPDGIDFPDDEDIEEVAQVGSTREFSDLLDANETRGEAVSVDFVPAGRDPLVGG
jgi:hypothetical protein